MTIDPARALVGIATTFGRPGADGLTLEQQHFDRFLADAPPVPLLHDHLAYRPALGTVMRYKPVSDMGSCPAGLLILAETVDAQLADDVRDWALSIRATVVYEDDELTQVRRAWIREVSICQAGADDLALVLAAGPSALTTWELLTGETLLVGQAG